MQPTEDATFNLLLTSNASYEDSAWKNAEFDALVQKAGRSHHHRRGTRAEAYTKAQELILARNALHHPILRGCPDGEQVTTSRIGYTINPINRYFYTGERLARSRMSRKSR